MSPLESFALWMESTRVAGVVGTSMWTIASLSAVHVLGYVLVMGGGVITNLKLMQVVLPTVSVQDVIRPATRGLLLGLSISLFTGLLLVSWKATSAVVNPIFLTKMALLILAAVLHFAWARRVSARAAAGGHTGKLAGGLGLTLWLALAIAACAYILFE
jgi:uncharacterized membrane protein